MSLPAWNRKAPSRAAIAATLSALTVFGASSVATADVSPNGYGQPAFGYGFQGQAPAPYGPAFGYGPQPASTYGAPVQSAPPQGYGQPVPQIPGYGLPVPGGFPIPGAPVAGFGPYGGGFPDYGFSSQWGHFAPSEPNYAPHERAGAKAPAPVAAAPASAPAPAQPAAPSPAPAKTAGKPAPATATTSSDYSYEIAPATNSTYVGSSTQFGSAPTTYSDPYQSIVNQQSGTTGYQVTTPSYTQQYDNSGYTQQYDTSASYPEATPAAPAAPDYSNYVPAPEYNVTPSYSAPAATQNYAPSTNYTVAAPAPQAPEPINTGRYEYQSAAPSFQQAAPSYQQSPQSYEQAPADYYDLSASKAAAAVAAPSYEVSAYAPPQQVRRGGHFVQVGAFLDHARAQRLVNKLGASGQQAFIVQAQVRGRQYHRVRIGGGSRRDARAIRDQVRELGYYEARVVKG